MKIHRRTAQPRPRNSEIARSNCLYPQPVVRLSHTEFDEHERYGGSAVDDRFQRYDFVGSEPQVYPQMLTHPIFGR